MRHFFEQGTDGITSYSKGAGNGSLRESLAQRCYDENFFFNTQPLTFGMGRPNLAAGLTAQSLCATSIVTIAYDRLGL